MKTIKINETSVGYNFTVPKLHNMRYLNWFIKSKCAPDLLALQLFPNVKEITESFGALSAVVDYLMRKKEYFTFKDKVRVIVIGDGSTPRTGALFAFKSGWDVTSIDPNLNIKDAYSTIKRLGLMKCKFGDNELATLNTMKYDITLIICVHSHANLEKCLDKIIGKNIFVISIPCCVPDNIGKPLYSYEDHSILSPKRTVNIYKIKE